MSAPSLPHGAAALDLVETARRHGVAAGVDRMGEQLLPDTLLCGAGGWGVAGARAVDRAMSAVVGDRVYARAETAVSLRPVRGARGDDLVAVHVRPLPHARAADAPPSLRADVARALGYVRLGVAMGLRDAAQEYLAGRTVGEVPLLQQQMVKAALADATLDLLLARAQLDGPALSIAAGARVHGRLTQAGRTLLSLLGATSFLAGGSGSVAHVCELLENVLVPAAHRDELTA